MSYNHTIFEVVLNYFVNEFLLKLELGWKIGPILLAVFKRKSIGLLLGLNRTKYENNQIPATNFISVLKWHISIKDQVFINVYTVCV